VIDPRVTVLPSAYEEGALSHADDRRLARVLPLSEALSHHWDTDAHFAFYTFPGRPEWPRVRKGHEAQAELEFPVVAIDQDSPQHDPWTPETRAAFTEQLAELLPPELDPTWFYWTPRGCRAVYVLDRPAPLARVEGLLAGLVRDWTRAGFSPDHLCDWTRLMRLPSTPKTVHGVHLRADLTPHGPGPLLDWGKIVPGSVATGVDAPAPRRPLPSAREAQALLETAGAGNRTVQSDWYTEARKLSRSSVFFPVAFQDKPLSSLHPSRNEAIQRAVGSASTRLRRVESEPTTPEHVWALLMPAILAAVDQDDPANRRSLPHELWKACLAYRAKDDMKAHLAHARRTADAEAKVDLLEQVLDGARTWAPHADEDWLRRHLVVRDPSARHHYVLNPRGKYEAVPLSKHAVVSFADQIGMRLFVPAFGPNPRDPTALRRRTADEVVADAAVYVDLEARPGLPEGGFLDPMGRLIISAYTRADDPPCFDPVIDEYLHAFWGKHYDEIARWVSCALAIEEGMVCALSLTAASGAGKGLLAQALADCFSSRRFASAHELTGEFQSELEKSPLLVIDEGMVGGSNVCADAFRRVVGGGSLRINPKGHPSYAMQNRVRMLMTANDTRMVMDLVSRVVGEDGIQALARRIFHRALGSGGERWLAAHGGETLAMTWVGPDSDRALARHFLWLHKTIDRTQGRGLLLMDGDLDASLREKLTLSQAGVTEVGLLLLQALNSRSPYVQPGPGGALYLAPQGILERVKESGYRLTTAEVMDALGEVVGPAPRSSFRLGKPPRKVRWRLIRMDRAATLAEELGADFNPPEEGNE